MCNEFQLVDLRSQAPAVQRLLSGLSNNEKLAWLRAQGKLTDVAHSGLGARRTYRFESSVDLQCFFFIDGDELVFIGDHTTYTIRDGNA